MERDAAGPRGCVTWITPGHRYAVFKTRAEPCLEVRPRHPVKEATMTQSNTPEDARALLAARRAQQDQALRSFEQINGKVEAAVKRRDEVREREQARLNALLDKEDAKVNEAEAALSPAVAAVVQAFGTAKDAAALLGMTEAQVKTITARAANSAPKPSPAPHGIVLRSGGDRVPAAEAGSGNPQGSVAEDRGEQVA
jgi:hypothetical protein